jgi:hypothetical protein
MKKEADSGKVTNVKQVQKCISYTTGVSVSALKHILKEHNKHNKTMGKKFSIPHKKSLKRKLK